MILRMAFLAAALAASPPALADQVTIAGGTVYVTKNDCAQLVAHRPAPDVAYKPGVDVHGKYVAPANVDGNDYSDLVPTNGARFNVVVNPMNYTGLNTTQGSSSQGRYDNTALPVAHVDVNLKTGETTINGRKLTTEQDRIVLEACRKAGYR